MTCFLSSEFCLSNETDRSSYFASQLRSSLSTSKHPTLSSKMHLEVLLPFPSITLPSSID